MFRPSRWVAAGLLTASAVLTGTPPPAQAFSRFVAAGEPAEDQLRKALQGQPSAEVRQKVGEILAEGARPRLLWSLQILEQINTLPARQLLKDLAAGASDAWLTRQAEASCNRLAGRPVAEVSTDEPPKPASPLPKIIVTEGPPAVPRRPGRDRYGDPLSKGATARIGTLRLRHQGEARAVAFSPDGKALAAGVGVGYSDNMVLLWDTVSGKLRCRCRGPQQGKIVFLAFAPNGESLAGGQAGRVRLWSVRTGEELRCFAGTDTSMRAGAFSADGKALVTASEDGNLRVWDTASGREVRRLIGHGGYHVGDVAFSPDGRLVATGSSDGTVLVWDARPLTRHRPPPCPSAPRRLDDLWTDLAGTNATRAYDALWALVRRPEDAVPLLRDRLRSVPPQDAKRIASLIADLDSAQFEVRRNAAAELEKLGELAEPAMRKALADRPSLEVRRRLEQLVEKLEHADYSAEQLRAFRAVAVLERIGNLPAWRVLDGLAQGAPGARLTQEARTSLARLASRGPSP